MSTSALHPSSTVEPKDGHERIFPVRDVEKLFCSSITLNCALESGCIPCSYKIGCFDVSLDAALCQKVPNVRPEMCPRANQNASKPNLEGGRSLVGCRLGTKILTVGDGDLTFSLAVARLLESTKGQKSELVFTSYESRSTCNKLYKDFEKTTSELESLGAILCFEVDATRLVETLPGGVAKSIRSFDKIFWNFPCTAVEAGQDGQNAAMEMNKQMIREFVENARQLAAQGGEIMMCHKTKPPFNQWRIEEVAIERCRDTEPVVLYAGCVVLDKVLLPPYTPRKALHSKSFPHHDSVFYVFRVAKSGIETRSRETILLDMAKEYEAKARRSDEAPNLIPVTSSLIISIRQKLLDGAVRKIRPKKKRKRGLP